MVDVLCWCWCCWCCCGSDDEDEVDDDDEDEDDDEDDDDEDVDELLEDAFVGFRPENTDVCCWGCGCDWAAAWCDDFAIDGEDSWDDLKFIYIFFSS